MKSNKILFCDTDLITTQIYSEYYLSETPDILFDLEKEIKYDIYFLCYIDIPWVADGLRDLGHKREELFEIFKHELEIRNIDYVIVSGNWENRLKIVTETLKLKFNICPN